MRMTSLSAETRRLISSKWKHVCRQLWWSFIKIGKFVLVFLDQIDVCLMVIYWTIKWNSETPFHSCWFTTDKFCNNVSEFDVVIMLYFALLNELGVREYANILKACMEHKGTDQSSVEIMFSNMYIWSNIAYHRHCHILLIITGKYSSYSIVIETYFCNKSSILNYITTQDMI